MTDLLPRSDQLPRIAFARTPLAPEASDAVAGVLKSGWLTTGPQVQEFEREIGAYLGAEDAIAVSSCTAAIELSLRALRLPPGSKVLASTITFCGAVNAILHAGLVPVLVDVNPDTLMPDAETTAVATAVAGGVDAMTVVHFAGYPAPVEEMAEAAGLPLNRVVEDAAHAFGARLGDRAIGTVSGATCFSFYATKNLPIGEGGMVTTADPDIGDAIRRGRLHGMTRDAWGRYLPGANWRYTVETPGLKANMTDIQAAIGRAQLPKFDEWQARRAELVARYDEALAGIDGLTLPARPAANEGTHAWHLYVVRVGDGFPVNRDIFMQQLAADGIDCSVHFIPVHSMTHMQNAIGKAADPIFFPEAERAAEEIVSLPLYPGLSDSDVDRICAAVADVASSSPATLQGGAR